MPDIEIASSPLVSAGTPVRIHYRDVGSGHPLFVLHGGWGYEIYAFDRQIAALSRACRIVIPDRSGYGRSPAIDDLPPDFHHRAAAETRSVIDALGLPAPILWGHSDGAIIALLLGLARPARIAGLIVEATHLYKRKPSSRAFFEATAADPASIGGRAAAVLMRDHGERWQHIVELHSRAWLRISDEARSAVDDFYDGRLGELDVPVLLVHGAGDPRTEPGELNALRAALAVDTASPRESAVHRDCAIFADAGHSPHGERATADAVTGAALRFLNAVGAIDPAADSGHPARPRPPADPAIAHPHD